jgi:uncharacterized protein
MSKVSPSRRQLVVIALASLLGACGTSPASRRFLLVPRSSATALPFNGRIVIAAAGIAKYLDQPQIVRRSSSVELTLAEFELWGEGLADMVARVLAEDLAERLAGGEVFAGDGAATVPADAGVELYVERFDPDPDGTVILNVRWTIRRRGSAPRLGAERIAQRPASPATTDLVGAMSDALAKLADRLAPLLIG